jgi:hypothetical protein
MADGGNGVRINGARRSRSRNARRRAWCASIALSVLALTACAGSGGMRAPSYGITPEAASVAPGATQQFSVIGVGQVRWGLMESSSIAAAEAPAYPVKVSEDGRYLVDRDDRPWRVQADAGWLISSQSTPEELDQYLAIRQAQGFNSFYLMAMVHPGGYGEFAPDAPNNQFGDLPFATPGDFSTAGGSPASARYWDWIDSIIANAASHDMVVMLAYTYLGWRGGDQGWYQDILSQPSRQSLFDWGAWLGKRYKDTPNLIWFGMGDYTPPAGSEGALRVRAIADGIKSTGASQPFMAEPSGPDEIPGEAPEFGSIVDLNSFYGYGPGGVGTAYVTADRAWRFTPTKPAFMQEGTYEFENNLGHFSTQPWDTRRGRFWSVLAGGTAGDGFGSKDVWHWDRIPESLSSPGAQYSKYAFQLFASMPWWELQPSGTDAGFAGIQLVPAGGGTWGKPDYITAALTAGHDWLLAYVPVMQRGERTFSVDMSALNGPIRARWFDPATGNYLAVSDGHEYANSGVQEFTTPGIRGDGTDDWLLVLDSSGTAGCGSITTAGVYTAPTANPGGVTCKVTAADVDDPSVVVSEVIRFSNG